MPLLHDDPLSAAPQPLGEGIAPIRTTEASLLVLLLVSSVGEQLFGLTIGFIPVAMQYEQDMMNCTAYTAPGSCRGVERAGCVWHAGTCGFADYATVQCGNHSSDAASCRAAAGDVCFFRDGACHHAAGWTAHEQGLFAACIILGAMAGSALAARVMDRIGRKRTTVLIALVALIGQALTSAAWELDVFGLLIAARVVAGFAVGLITCVCPIYVGEMAPERYRVRLGALFQCNYAFAVMFIALVGYLVDPQRFRGGSSVSLEALFQVLTVPAWMSGVATLALGLWMPESAVWLATVARAKTKSLNEQAALLAAGPNADDDATDERKRRNSADVRASSVGGVSMVNEEHTEGPDEHVSWGALVRCTAFTLGLSVALQFTGNSAMLSYAPAIIHDSVGIDPFLGNLLVSAWNFVFTFVGIAVARHVTNPVPTYALGTGVASVACVLVGVAKYPGIVAAGSVEELALAAVSIGTFLVAFQVGIACFFYMIAQGVFPGKYRSAGCSFALLATFSGELSVFYAFPLVVEGLSGGPSGDQAKGLALVFFGFGAIGFCCVAVVLLAKPLHLIAVRVADAETEGEVTIGTAIGDA